MKETILLVDDEQGIRTVMGLSLRDAGYNVITVASGEEALQLFAERPIPIVITDIRMPGMNGLDLLKHIKILAPETEVILISGHADLEMAIQGLKLEASDFITKPIDDDLLHISLKRALERIAMRNKLKEYTSNLEKMINEKSAQLVEAERQLAARQVVDGFAFGLHTLGSSMSGEQQAFNELPCFIAMHDRFMEVLAVNDLYRERLGNLVGHPSWEPYVLHSNEAMFPVERAIVEGRGARSEQILRDKNGKEMLASHAKEYVNVLCSVILENALKQEYDYKTFQWAELMSWLKSESKRNSYPEPQAAYQIAYAKAQGTDRLKRTVDRGFKKALNFYRDDNNALKEPKDVDQEEMSFSLDALCQALPKEELVPWMKNMLDTCPDGFKYKPKNKKETKIHPFYSALTKNYMSLADDSEKSRVKSEMKEASDRILELSQDKKGDGNGSSGRRRRR